MSAAEYLRFFTARIRNPHALLAIREGFGIERRAARCRPYWAHHLERTKRFITSAVAHSNPREIVVLGAGRLFDLPLEAFAPPLKRVTLVDYDPSCARFWSAARRALHRRDIELIGVQTDITGRMMGLVERLQAATQTEKALSAARVVRELRNSSAHVRNETLSNLRGDLVISLNLLSQLGIGVRRIVQRAIATAPWQGDRDEHTLAHHIREYIFQLEFEHLELLSSSARTSALLITDEQFIDYHADDPHWHESAALELPLPLAIPGMEMTAQESWYWHLAPQGVEYQDRGEIHRVAAYAASIRRSAPMPEEPCA